MKNLIITLLSVLALSITFTGCGESAGNIASSVEESSVSENMSAVESVEAVESEAVAVATTPSTPFNLSSTLGTPPGLPGN